MDFYNNEIRIWNEKQHAKTYRAVTTLNVAFGIPLSTYEK